MQENKRKISFLPLYLTFICILLILSPYYILFHGLKMTHPGRPGGLLCSWIATPTPEHPPHHHTRQDHTNTNRDTPRAPWWPSLLMDRHTHTRTPTTPPHPPGSHRHQQRHNRGARPPYKSHQDPGHLGQIHTQPNTGGGLVGLRRGPGAYLPGPPRGVGRANRNDCGGESPMKE